MEVGSVIFLCLLVISVALGKNGRIIGGQFTDIQECPYIVSLRLYSTNQLICAGSIVSIKHILTAAHCVYDMRNGFADLRAYGGSTTLSGIHRSSYFITNIDVHPHFVGLLEGHEQKQHDVAVLTVRGVIRFSQVQHQVELPTEDVIPNTNAVLYGWGRVREPRGRHSDILRKATVQVLDRSRCEQIFPHPLYDDFICTYRSRRGSAVGDSGGPLISNNKLIGIISFSVPWIENTPDIQTNVFQHLDFINSIIRNANVI